MNEEKIIIIDLSSTHISAVAAEVSNDGSVCIIAEESKPSRDIKQGIVEQMSGVAFGINAVIRLLQNRLQTNRGIDIDTVHVGLNAKSMKHFPYSITRNFRDYTAITEATIANLSDEAEEAFRLKDVDVFDVIPQSYHLDGKYFEDPVGHKAYEICSSYAVVGGNKKIRENLDRCFDRTGLKLSPCMPIAAEALSKALLDDEERESGCALIHFGHSTTTLAIYAEGTLRHLLVVPLGGHNLTKDIQELGISEHNAERLKVKKGCALKNRVSEVIRIRIPSAESGMPDIVIESDFLATIIEARLEEICTPIFKVLEECPFELKAGIVITGGASKLEYMAEFVETYSGMSVRYGDHSGWLSPDTNERYYDPSYSLLIGNILLIDEYNKENPTAPTKAKEPKIPKENIRTRIVNTVLKLFDDDNQMK